jgi:hypothetical protein
MRSHRKLEVSVFKLFAIGIALCSPFQIYAAEGFNVRLLGGTLGREVISPTNPGHYTAINLIYYNTDEIKDGNGDDLINTVSAGQNGAIKIPVAVDFEQKQTTALLRYTYITEEQLAGAKVGGTIAVPLLKKDRTLRLTPAFPATTPAQVRNGVNASLASTEALNNADASGVGDIEIAPVMTWEGENSKISFSPTIILPTGNYDPAIAVNVGQGDFYTFRPAISWGYVVSDNVQIGARFLWGINSKNKGNDYKSGQFISLEGVAYRSFGSGISLGFNTFFIDQITDDTGPTAPVDGGKLRVYGAGGAIGWQSLGGAFEVKLNQEFSGRNVRQGGNFIVRYTRAL